MRVFIFHKKDLEQSIELQVLTLPRHQKKHEFILSQHQKEIKVNHFSEPFSQLLLGMNVVPVHVVPKPIDKLRLIVDYR